MRLIGHLESEQEARVFGDFLYVQGIDNQVEREGNTSAIWVHSDDQLETARQLLGEFRANPADAKFRAKAEAATKLREQAKADDAAYEKKLVTGRKMFPGMTSYGFGIVTYGLIVASIVVFVVSGFGDAPERISALFITKYEISGNAIRWLPNLPEIRHGQIWRLVTPMIIHFGFLHILFNTLWVRDLGSMMEARLGSLYFAVFVVVVAIASHLAQYMWSGPAFGGMSGITYALIGYVWIRGRFDPAAGLFLSRENLVWALVWFGVCFTGLVGPIANVIHTVGLVLGMAWAFVDSKRK